MLFLLTLHHGARGSAVRRRVVDMKTSIHDRSSSHHHRAKAGKIAPPYESPLKNSTPVLCTRRASLDNDFGSAMPT